MQIWFFRTSDHLARWSHDGVGMRKWNMRLSRKELVNVGRLSFDLELNLLTKTLELLPEHCWDSS